MKLKVISYNIWNKNREETTIAKRAPLLNEVVSKYDADLIGIQEYVPAWEEHIEKYFGKDYDIFNKYRASDKPESSPILWKKDKFDLVDTGYFWMSDTPEIESRGWDERFDVPRICEYVVLKHKETGKKFTFMNTHFGFGDKCQVDSAKLIYEYSQKISNNPTFVTGDFNMSPKALGYAEMTKNFVDVNEATTKETIYTYHGFKLSEPHDRIDFCFVDKNITPITSKTITDDINGKLPSDHYGVFSEIEI